MTLPAATIRHASPPPRAATEQSARLPAAEGRPLPLQFPQTVALSANRFRDTPPPPATGALPAFPQGGPQAWGRKNLQRPQRRQRGRRPASRALKPAFRAEHAGAGRGTHARRAGGAQGMLLESYGDNPNHMFPPPLFTPHTYRGPAPPAASPQHGRYLRYFGFVPASNPTDCRLVRLDLRELRPGATAGPRGALLEHLGLPRAQQPCLRLGQDLPARALAMLRVAFAGESKPELKAAAAAARKGTQLPGPQEAALHRAVADLLTRALDTSAPRPPDPPRLLHGPAPRAAMGATPLRSARRSRARGARRAGSDAAAARGVWAAAFRRRSTRTKRTSTARRASSRLPYQPPCPPPFGTADSARRAGAGEGRRVSPYGRGRQGRPCALRPDGPGARPDTSRSERCAALTFEPLSLSRR